MESHDDYYDLKGSIQNLMLLKLAYDYGVDIKALPGSILNYEESLYQDWEIFMSIVESLFTIVEYWLPHSGDENLDDKLFWTEDTLSDLKEIGVMVILDDRINPAEVYSGCLCSGGSDWICGFAEMEPYTEKGMIIKWEENEGNVDWVDVLYGILHSIPNKERKEDAVAN
jgi:hypothetical protein